MNRFIKDFTYLAKKFWFIVPLLAVVALSYGFQLCNLSIGADSLSRDRYLFEGQLFAIGRFTHVILAPLLHFESFFPFAEEFFSILLLVCSAISLCVVLKRASGDKLHDSAYTVFACVFVSYPLINEIWVYALMNWGIPLVYLLAAISLLLVMRFMESKKKYHIILSVVPMIFGISIYESFVNIYLCIIFVIFILNFLYADAPDKNLKRYAFRLIQYLLPLIAAIVIEFLITKLITAIFPDIPLAHGAATKSYYGSLGLIGGLSNFLTQAAEKFLFASAWYLPITILVFSLALSAVMAIIIAIKKKRPLALLLFLGLQLSLIALSLVLGRAALYRNCQEFSIFVALIFMLLMQFALSARAHRFFKGAVICVVVWLCLIQSIELNQWFVLNNMKYKQEVTLANEIAYELESKFTTDKPVVFIGSKYEHTEIINKYLFIGEDAFARQLPPFKNIYPKTKRLESNLVRYFSWSILCYDEPNTELLKFFTFLGHDLKQGTVEMFNEALEYGKNMPSFPALGSITDAGDYIIVKLSDNELSPLTADGDGS